MVLERAAPGFLEQVRARTEASAKNAWDACRASDSSHSPLFLSAESSGSRRAIAPAASFYKSIFFFFFFSIAYILLYSIFYVIIIHIPFLKQNQRTQF
jgi:hypothetical protein